MADSDAEKPHDATEHRRQEARKQGQVARSQDLASAALLVAGLTMLRYSGTALVHYLANLFKEHLGGQAWIQIDPNTGTQQWLQTCAALGQAMFPFLGVVLLVAIGVNLWQVGFLLLPEKIGFNASHINPLQNAQRIFSFSSIVRLCFGFFKIGLVSGIAAIGLWNDRERLMGLAELDGAQVAIILATSMLDISLLIAYALLLLALLDYAYQYQKMEADMRMSHQEMREELKDQNGNPQMTSRRKAAHRQLTKNSIRTTVPKADAIISNPTELAIAIKFDMETMSAPVVLAKGAGAMAQGIRRIALESGIPIVERKELAQILYKSVEVGKAIPVEQYAAVAEVLRYVYQLQGKKLPAAKAA